MLDGYFYALLCGKNCFDYLKRAKINEKEAQDDQYKDGPNNQKGLGTANALNKLTKRIFNSIYKILT